AKGTGTAAPGDDDDHGTAVAGLVVAANNGIGGVGVAFDAELAAYRHSGGPYSIAFEYVRIIDRMIENGIDVTVNSWGPLGYPFDQADIQDDYLAAGRKIVA